LPKHLFLCLGLLQLALLCMPAAALAVEAVAMFRDRAVIRVGDSEQLLRVGETASFGVTLLSATPLQATIRYRGEVLQLTLSRRVGGSFAAPSRAVVRINRDRLGQYRLRGTIDRQPVDFLIDTGASVVAMSESQATALGLDPAAGQLGVVQTAQGAVEAHFVTLDQVTLGSIVRHHVAATIIMGDYPREILLGMSFLRDLQMTDSEGVLTLSLDQ